MKGYKRVRIFPDRDLRATRLEIAVIDTAMFQRLRNVSQLGNSKVVFPTAEHSRFSHSLGTLYWASKMIDYLKSNHFASNNIKILNKANDAIKMHVLVGLDHKTFEEEIECTCYEQLLRLIALLHDITHLPFGHTLEDQTALLTRHDEDVDRIVYIYDKLIEEVKESPHLEQIDAKSNLYSNILHKMLQQCKAIYSIGKSLPEYKIEDSDNWSILFNLINFNSMQYLTLAYDIVSNTICADLIDYIQRDHLFASMPRGIDKALLSYLKILKEEIIIKSDEHELNHIYRLGICVARRKIRHDVVTALLDLLRSRYDLAEKINFHHAKVTADAMLDKIVRYGQFSFDWKYIVDNGLGDEGLINLIADELSRKGDEISLMALNILLDMKSRRFVKAVFRIHRSEYWSKTTNNMIKKCLTPEGRTELEKMLADKSSLNESDVIINCLPQDMQLKEAKAKVEWIDGDVCELRELPVKHKYLFEIEDLTNRYLDLWALNVYINHGKSRNAPILIESCEELFNIQNDQILHEYIKNKWKDDFDIQEGFKKIERKAERVGLNLSARDGKYTGNNIDEAYLTVLEDNRKDKSKTQKQPKKTRRKTNNNSKDNNAAPISKKKRTGSKKLSKNKSETDDINAQNKLPGIDIDGDK